MLICDRCKSKPARVFVYGDAVNADYLSADFCCDCVDKLRRLISAYQHNKDVVVINHPVSDFPEDK